MVERASLRQLLYLAPDQKDQAAIAAICGSACSEWLARWGGWHITVGRTAACESVSGTGALAAAAGVTLAGRSVVGGRGWQPLVSGAGLCRRVHGVPLASPITRLLSKNYAVYLRPGSPILQAASSALRRLGWPRVTEQDFHVTIGPRAELDHSTAWQVVEALRTAKWVWVLAVEKIPGAGTFQLDWASARPCLHA